MIENRGLREIEPMKKHKLDSLAFRALAYDLLRAGHSLRFQAQGRSMLPTIQDGDVLQVAPVQPQQLRRGDIVLVDLQQGGAGKLRAHRLVSKDLVGDQFASEPRSRRANERVW